MELWYAPTSPFARKVRIAAHELDLAPMIDLKQVNPWTNLALRNLNPLAKVPTLVLDDGRTLFESAVICEYLDTLGGHRLFPADGDERWRALLLQGMADGAMTAAGRLFADERRAVGERSEVMMGRFRDAICATVETLEKSDLLNEPTIGEISVGAFLSYLDFRWPEHTWRNSARQLSGWFDHLSARPSMMETPYRLIE